MILEDLRDQHKGETIFVLGSGKSVDFYSPSFFTDRLTIAVNHGWSNWLPRVDYMVTKYHRNIEPYSKSDKVGLLIVSRGQSGQLDETVQDSSDYVVFDHAPNRVAEFTAEDFPSEGLVVSYSTITSAMHLAAYMGAAHIIVVGADCGWLDDEPAVSNHPSSLSNPDFARHFDLQNRIVADQIRSRYGASVVSLSPFVTPNMEGHKYVSPFGSLNVT